VRDLAKILSFPNYEDYLYLRRQLGEQENGDMPAHRWDGVWPLEQKRIIKELVGKCLALQKDRDLSWENYLALVPSGNRSFESKAEWEVQPLFIQAAIIPRAQDVPRRGAAAPAGRFDGSRLASKDRPKGIVDNW
jgi:hypothetical protein